MTIYKILEPSKGHYLLERNAITGLKEYMDFKENEIFWWTKSSVYFKDCTTKNKTKVIMQYNILTDQDYTSADIETLVYVMKPFHKRISDAIKLGFKNFPTIRLKL